MKRRDGFRIGLKRFEVTNQLVIGNIALFNYTFFDIAPKTGTLATWIPGRKRGWQTQP